MKFDNRFFRALFKLDSAVVLCLKLLFRAIGPPLKLIFCNRYMQLFGLFLAYSAVNIVIYGPFALSAWWALHSPYAGIILFSVFMSQYAWSKQHHGPAGGGAS
jgi:hypothetical protein